MNETTDEQLQKTARHVLQYTLFHLVKELRDAGVTGSLGDMPGAVKSILVDALWGAVAEVNADLQTTPILDWEANARTWALFSVFGESNIPGMRLELERLSGSTEGSEFQLCGVYAARSLMQALQDG